MDQTPQGPTVDRGERRSFGTTSLPEEHILLGGGSERSLPTLTGESRGGALVDDPPLWFGTHKETST